MSNMEVNPRKVGAVHSTVAVSLEDLAKIHKASKIEDRPVKSIVKIALREYFERRPEYCQDIESETTEVLYGGFVQ